MIVYVFLYLISMIYMRSNKYDFSCFYKKDIYNIFLLYYYLLYYYKKKKCIVHSITQDYA